MENVAHETESTGNREAKYIKSERLNPSQNELRELNELVGKIVAEKKCLKIDF